MLWDHTRRDLARPFYNKYTLLFHAKIENVMSALTQQLENCLSCMNVDYITDYYRVHGQNLALSHGVIRDRDGLSSPPTNQRFGTV